MRRLEDILRSMNNNIIGIESIESFRPGYLFFPARVTLRLGTGNCITYVVKTQETYKPLEFEMKVLQALDELGLIVPKIESDIFFFTHEGKELYGVLMEDLRGRGESLPWWLGLHDWNEGHRTCLLTLEGVQQLHRLTNRIQRHPIHNLLPYKTLLDEYEFVKAHSNQWKTHPSFQKGMSVLEQVLPTLNTPLVFSNGDYNPLNFMAKGEVITGWIDFEHACFEDPHIGFTKFFLWADDDYGWGAGRKIGLVERYLFENEIQPEAFYYRLILRGLRDISHTSIEKPPHYMLEVVDTYISKVISSKSYF